MEIDELLDDLERDDTRFDRPFSAEIIQAHRDIFRPAITRAEIAAFVNDWLLRYQPCLFGRATARLGRLSYCVLTDADFAKGDDHVQEAIQDARRAWKVEALEGRRHGFLILAISPRIAYARPSTTLLELARRLCELYLSRRGTNEIYHDELMLRVAESDAVTRRLWKVGANVFAAAGDQRWWHDHRIPGGLAFSMNSVGHMSRAMLDEHLRAGRKSIAVPADQLMTWAVPFAMRTILTAERGGPLAGTRLAPRTGDEHTMVPDAQREQVLKADLAPFSENRYFGWYHTDETIPEEYFTDAYERPAEVAERALLFTYLHDVSDDAYASMGIGMTPEEWTGAAYCEQILQDLGLEDLEK